MLANIPNKFFWLSCTPRGCGSGDAFYKMWMEEDSWKRERLTIDKIAGLEADLVWWDEVDDGFRVPASFSSVNPITSLLPLAPIPGAWHRATLLSTASVGALLSWSSWTTLSWSEAAQPSLSLLGWPSGPSSLCLPSSSREHGTGALDGFWYGADFGSGPSTHAEWRWDTRSRAYL